MSTTAVFEHSYYIGNYMSAILYGMELIVYCMTLRSLLRRSTPRRGDKFLAFYSTVLLFLVTIDISCNAVWGEQMWITFRDMPGGPSAFIVDDLSVWYQIVGSTSVVVLIFTGDALLLYRCFILWGSRYTVIALPVLTYLAAFSLAIIELVVAFTPGGFFFGGKSVIFGTAYYAMTIGLNITVTLLICGRLLYLSRLVRSSMGEENSKLYTGVITILIESAAPYSLVGIMFLVPYARSSQTAISFGQVWAKLACLSPQLIVFRVMTGRAWSKETIRGDAQSSVVFDRNRRLDRTMATVSVPLTELSDLNQDSTQGTRFEGDAVGKWNSDQNTQGITKV